MCRLINIQKTHTSKSRLKYNKKNSNGKNELQQNCLIICENVVLKPQEIKSNKKLTECSYQLQNNKRFPTHRLLLVSPLAFPRFTLPVSIDTKL